MPEASHPDPMNVIDPDTHKPRLCDGLCDTCIFHPSNRAGIRPGRLKEMIQGTVRGGGIIPCHHTIYRTDVRPAICRGFYERVGYRSNLIRIYERLGGFTEITPPAKKAEAVDDAAP